MIIYITAIVKFKQEHVQTAADLLGILVSASKKEEACLQYDLFQDTEDKSRFIIHETWKDQDGLILHTQQAHYMDFGKKASSMLDGPVGIYKTERLK